MLSSRDWTFCIARGAKTEQPRASALGMRPPENRPKGAADWRSLVPNITFVRVDSIRTPFQGEFVARHVPRAKALGCSLFALRAMRFCIVSRGLVLPFKDS